MDRVEQIIQHELAADADQATRSAHRWMAAKLIYDEVESGTSKTALGEAIGKHRTHVLFCWRAWDLVGKHYSDDNDFADFPVFNITYHSDEIRHPNGSPETQEGSNGKSGRKHRGKEDQKEEDLDPDRRETAHDWVGIAARCFELMEAHPITWQFLTEQDMVTLRGLPDRTAAIIKEIDNA